VVAGFAVFVLVLVGVIVYGWWDSQMGPPHSKALQVGDTTLNLDLFSRRLKVFLQESGLTAPGTQINSSQVGALTSYVAASLEQEMLVRQRAPVDLGLTATPDAVEGAIASRLNVLRDDAAAFQAAYAKELKTKGLSDKEYREMVEGEVLSTQVQDGFVRAAPEVADQVRIRLIQVGAKEDADKVVERLNAGEDFAVVAKEMSGDTATKDKGGEKGWVTLEELETSYAAKVFALDVGQRSEPLEGQGGFLIFEVEEKQAGRPVESAQRTDIGSRYFSLWLDEQRTLVPTTDYVLTDADKYQWVVNHAL
jgi:parvulin-like peptidyl-prolyl isomerase